MTGSSDSILRAAGALRALAGTTLRDFGGGFSPGNQRAADMGRLARRLNAPVVMPRQVHGTRVVDAVTGAGEEADAIVCSDASLAVAIVTADCLPVMIMDPESGTRAACHAGWRGLAAGVIENTLTHFPTPDRIQVWIGPAICQDHFEVGNDVLDAFVAADSADAGHFVVNGRGRWQADLPGLAVARLKRGGVRHISCSRECTFCDPRRFFSHRRDGSPGRHCSFIVSSPSI